MERKNFNEVLKEKERLQKAQLENVQDDKPLALDDSQRVKVLSPGQMVFKRFIRNRLAIVGSAILIFMFLFAFLFPLFYQHGQTDIFYKYDDLVIDYASASERTEYTSYVIDPEIEVHYSVAYMISTFAAEMNKTGSDVLTVYGTDEQAYIVEKLGDNVYTISAATAEPVATYDGVVASYNKGDGTIAYRGADLGDDFASAVADTLSGSEIEFTFDEHIYLVEPSDINNVYNVISVDNGTMSVSGSVGDDFMEQFVANVEAGAFVCDGKYYNIIESYDGSITIEEFSDKRPALLSSLYVFDAYDGAPAIDDNFRVAALLSMQNEGNFSFDGTDYALVENDGAYSICKADDTSAPLYELNTFSIRRYSGEDTLSIDFKNLAKKTIQDMKDAGTTTSQFVYQLPQMDDEGQYVYDEDGNLTLVDTDITVTQKGDMYVFNCEQVTYLIDIYADSSLKKGSWDHIFGTDADGMDVLARMMYGGRISLMVGFVVVIIEVLLGVILGGIAGFFGGWVDTLIMRLVDIFYCIPSMPILIILGAVFDTMKLDTYTRLMIMMAVIGFLGWASVARLVRGQILSLREQEFMTAAEATGISASRRIFKHLVPNVMPQLIVTATMSLGSVIIYESTLSFLGLGVKHPLATWGTMINSVTNSNENLKRYWYIWIPVGALICLTVIAFNFVGDGLRDAFDPKMKR